nr:RNA polymerase sigma-I factor [Desulfolucanica intricata]
MKKLQLEKVLRSAQKGDPRAREALIKSHKDFIAKISSGVCRRFLSWDNDDELSVALLAFNEAIDRFDQREGAAFHSFARRVIKNRLIDYFRKEAKHRHISLSPMEADDEEFSRYDVEYSCEQFHMSEKQEILAEVVANYIEVLRQYGVTLDDLVKVSPKHRDRKDTLTKVARRLSAEPELIKYLKKFKCLPLKELKSLTGVSRRTLENGRKYIIALVLILSEPGFYPLKSFIQLPGAGTGEKVSPQ